MLVPAENISVSWRKLRDPVGLAGTLGMVLRRVPASMIVDCRCIFSLFVDFSSIERTGLCSRFIDFVRQDEETICCSTCDLLLVDSADNATPLMATSVSLEKMEADENGNLHREVKKNFV